MPPMNQIVVQTILLPPDRRDETVLNQAKNLLAKSLAPVNENLADKDYLIGERGKAYLQMAQLFDTNRAYIGLKCIGAAQASVDETCEFAKHLW